jgi:hypothetical protein
MNICTYVNIYIYVYTHTYIYIYTHIYNTYRYTYINIIHLTVGLLSVFSFISLICLLSDIIGFTIVSVSLSRDSSRMALRREAGFKTEELVPLFLTPIYVCIYIHMCSDVYIYKYMYT